MFEPAGLVRLFCLSHFLCPPSRFICAGLADVELGGGVHIVKQEWWGREVKRELRLSSQLLTSTLKHSTGRGGEMFTSASFFCQKPAEPRVDLWRSLQSGKTKAKGEKRKKEGKKKSSVSQHAERK